jgi:uncharacterized protein (DUF2147 family)
MIVAGIRTAVLAALTFCVLGCGATTKPPLSPEGRWVTASRNLIVSIARCGGDFCGSVSAVLANNSMMGAGESAVAPLPVGYVLVAHLRRDGDHWSGRIFNREDGRTYDCQIKRLTDGSLQVRPYVLTPLVGRTQIWAPAIN